MFHCLKVKNDVPGFTDITNTVKDAVLLSGISEGLCVVTTADPCAAVVFAQQDNDNAKTDILNELNIVLPPRVDYGKSENPYICTARTKAALVGGSKELVVTDGKLQLNVDRSICVINFVEAISIEVHIKCI